MFVIGLIVYWMLVNDFFSVSFILLVVGLEIVVSGVDKGALNYTALNKAGSL